MHEKRVGVSENPTVGASCCRGCLICLISDWSVCTGLGEVRLYGFCSCWDGKDNPGDGADSISSSKHVFTKYNKKNYNKGVHHVMSENNFRLYHHVQMVTNLLLPKYKFLKTVSYWDTIRLS